MLFEQPRLFIPRVSHLLVRFYPRVHTFVHDHLTTQSKMAGATNPKDAANSKNEVPLQRNKSCNSTEMMGFLFSDESQEKSEEDMAGVAGVATNNDDNTPVEPSLTSAEQSVAETEIGVVTATPDDKLDAVAATLIGLKNLA